MTTKKTGAKNQLPSNKQIEEKRGELSEFLTKLLSGEISLSTEKETISSKLILIKDILEPLRDAVIEKRITYSIISKAIEKQVGLKVSAQTLRSYCQNQLGFPKPERVIKQDRDNDNKQDNGGAKSYNAEETLSQKNMQFD
jgi:hypothetical protein